MSDDFRDISCFLLDMDGTIYLSDRLFPGVPEFLARLASSRMSIGSTAGRFTVAAVAVFVA